MMKVYFEAEPDIPYVPLIASYMDYGPFFKNSPFMKRGFEDIREQFVERVSDPSSADCIVLAHAYEHLLQRKAYRDRMYDIARTHTKPLIVFLMSDWDIKIPWDNVLIFRTSLYKSDASPRDIIIPPVIEDLKKSGSIVVRKLPAKPSVGFVGWAGFPTTWQMIKTRTKDILEIAHNIVRGKKVGPRRKGIFLRRRLLKQCVADSRIISNFIIRDSYSGSIKANPKLDVVQDREAYIANMESSDVTLAVRGDGNFSQRFYECLSLGRIPLLVDTDTKLPFEDEVPYERFVIKVPYDDRDSAVQYILQFFAHLTDEEYELRQREARRYFESHLSMRAFLQKLFVERDFRAFIKQMS